LLQVVRVVVVLAQDQVFPGAAVLAVIARLLD
jgi:hypothetical protein